MSHDNDRFGQTSYHTHSYGTNGRCACGTQAPHTCVPTTAGTCSVCGTPKEIKFDEPHLNTPTVIMDDIQPGQPGYVPLAARVPADGPVNLGSPVGPGFVVYEREVNGERKRGYDRKMALDSVGKGWHGLINQLFDRIEWDIKMHEGRFLGGLVLTQVKEKFGTLRIYWYQMNGDEGYADGYMSALEAASGHICEDCGNPGTIGGRGWVRTMCKACREACDRDKKLRMRDPGTEQQGA